MRSLIASALFLLPTWVGAADGSGLYKVCSDYFDHGTFSSVSVCGTGIHIVVQERKGAPSPEPRYEYRHFILTAAHVSQGTGLRVHLKSGVKPVLAKIIDRRADNIKDVEWIQIQNPSAQDPSLVQTSKYLGEVASFGFKRATDDRIYAYPEQIATWSHAAPTVSDKLAPSENMLQVSLKQYVPIPSWSKNSCSLKPIPYGSHFYDSIFYSMGSRERVSLEDYSGYLSSRARIVPGMSGSPLLGETFWGYEIQGIASEYDVQFMLSTFTGSANILSVLNSFQTETDQILGQARWRFHHSLTYLDYGNATLEISPRAGNGETNPGGNGETNRGGNGETQLGGNGETSRGNSTCSSASESQDDYLRKFEIHPGLTWKGLSKVVAFSLDGELIYANRAALDLISHRSLENTVIPITSKSGIGHKFPQRCGSLLNGLENKDEFELESYEYPFGSRASGKMEMGPAKLAYDNGVIRIQVQFFSAAKDELNFELNEDGALVGSESEEFQPRVFVKGASGKTYIIDLRQFYSNNASMIERAQMRKTLNRLHPRMTIRRSDNLTQYEVEFIRPL